MSKIGLTVNILDEFPTLSASVVAARSGYTREWIWRLARNSKIPYTIFTASRKQCRFLDTPKLAEWCNERRNRRLREKRYYQSIARRSDVKQKWSLTEEHLRILTRKRPKLDDVGRRMWVQLAKENSLTPDALRESIRRGQVTRVERDRGETSAGICTWDALTYDFILLLRQIGEKWKNWTPEEKEQVLKHLNPMVEFAAQLRGRRERSSLIGAS